MRFLRFLGRWGWLGLAIAALPLALVLYGHPPQGDVPLPDGALKTAATAMLARAGVAGTPIVVRGNDAVCGWGTVAGLGSAERIVISRGALTYPVNQTLWALAHEAGHVRRADPLLGVMVGWTWIVLALAMGQALTMWALRRWGWRGVAAFPLGIAIVWGVGLPAFNFIQRQVERRADRFGVEIAGSGADAAAFVARANACLGVKPTANLTQTLFRLTHDTTLDRIGMLRSMTTMNYRRTARLNERR